MVAPAHQMTARRTPPQLLLMQTLARIATPLRRAFKQSLAGGRCAAAGEQQHMRTLQQHMQHMALSMMTQRVSQNLLSALVHRMLGPMLPLPRFRRSLAAGRCAPGWSCPHPRVGVALRPVLMTPPPVQMLRRRHRRPATTRRPQKSRLSPAGVQCGSAMLRQQAVPAVTASRSVTWPRQALTLQESGPQKEQQR
jgi:hypothetical protein